MAVLAPITITPLTFPAPQRGDRDTFSVRYDAHITWQIIAAPQFTEAGRVVSHNANEAAASAEIAVEQAGVAIENAGLAGGRAAAAAASAGTANQFRNYAADSAAAALASEKAADTSRGFAQSWATAAMAAAALAGVPVYTGNARRVLTVNAAETGLEFAEVVTRVMPYTSRASLRVAETFPTQYLVRQLGLFEWQAGSLEPDDDATCFRTASGAWTMIAADPDFAAELWAQDLPLRTRFKITILTLAANAVADIIVPCSGASVGDLVAVIPNILLPVGLTINAVVTAAGSVTVRLVNPVGGVQLTLVPAYWSLQVIKQ